MCAIAQIDGASSTIATNATKPCGLGPCSGACKRFAAAQALLETKQVAAEPQFPLAISKHLRC